MNLPVIIQVPLRILVMVEGKSKSEGQWVVTPISMDPAHLVTMRSKRTSNTSLGLIGLLVKTTPKLKSSLACNKKLVKTHFKICLHIFFYHQLFVYIGTMGSESAIDDGGM